MWPDYRIDVNTIMAKGDTALITMTASGTFSKGRTPKEERHFSIPAALRVIVSDDLVSVWQVFANVQRMAAIYEANS